MKRIIPAALLLLFCFWGTPVFAAAPTAQITFVVDSPPAAIQDRTLLATAGAGPGDLAAQTPLSALNDYTATVEVEPGTYYCNAAVQYDYAGDYPVTEQDDIYEVTLQPGDAVTLHYTVWTTGYYETITGTARNAAGLERIDPPIGFDSTATAQIGVYLTAPQGFDQHVVVDLGNQYTGDSYTLDVYASNNLTAYEPAATAGQYQFLVARVVGDEAGRYSFSCEQEVISTDQGAAAFHLTVTDTENPDRELTTPKNEPSSSVLQDETPEPAATPEPAEPETTQQASFLTRLVKQIILLAVIVLAAVYVVIPAIAKHKKEDK